MESNKYDNEITFGKKKLKKGYFDLKLPEFIRIDWKRPLCGCKEECQCRNFKCQMTYTAENLPEHKAVDNIEEEVIDWSNLVNIDFLNITWRRAQIQDFKAIFQLVDDNCKRVFEVDAEGSTIIHLIEHSFCFLVAENFQGSIIGAISVNDFLPLCYLANAEWDSWLFEKYGLYKFRCYNTLWVHFLAYAGRYKAVIFNYLFVPIFETYHLVTKLAIYVPLKIKMNSSWVPCFAQVSTAVKPMPEEVDFPEDLELDEYPTSIYCTNRNQFVDSIGLGQLQIDDQEGIFNAYKTLEKHRRKFTKNYGKDFIRIFLQERRKFVFVGKAIDIRDRPPIFLIQTEFDLDSAKEKFDVYAFNNFKKNKATDFLMQPEKRYISAISQDLFEMSDAGNGEELKKFHEPDEKEDIEEKEEKDDDEGEPTVIEGLTWTNFLMTGTQDSDEEEGRGMDKILSTDNPIDKIQYKNLCMTMSCTNIMKDLKATTRRKTQATLSLSFESEGTFNAIFMEFYDMGSHTSEDMKQYFILLFQHFPSYDYLLFKCPRVLLPPKCCSYMMKVPPRGHKSWIYYEEELYFIHKWFLYGIVETRIAVKADFSTLLNILCMENSSNEIQEELFSVLFRKERRNKAFAFLMNKKIVGLAIVSQEREVEYYKFHFGFHEIMGTSLYNQDQVGYIKHMVINGLHEYRTRDFVRGILQLTGWNAVFFTRYPCYMNEQILDYSIPSGLKHFVPVKPRRVPQYNPSLSGRIPPYHLRNDYPPFALYFLNYRLSSVHKKTNHTKIVIVGTGDTGLSFLENVIFRSTSETELFTEIVVITHHSIFSYPRRFKTRTRKKSSQTHNKSEDLSQTWLNMMRERIEKASRPESKNLHTRLESLLRKNLGGVGDLKQSKDYTTSESTYKQFAEKMLGRKSKYTQKYLSKLGLLTWITVVEGSMTGIHRDEKCVEVDGKKLIPYDYLFLFCGRQFSTPQADTRNLVLGKECKALYDLRTPWYERVSVKPRNLFTINCIADATASIQYIKRLNPGRGQILVYGSCINALSCIESLLKFGVIPSRIAFVESDLNAPYKIDYFNDPVVYNATRKIIFDVGVSHFFYYNFANWDYNESTQLITKVHFESESRMASLRCLALFSFSPVQIYYDTINTYHDSNLVCDGGLVIDNEFKTSDPYIYAAGPGTRYKKMYFADHYFHEHYNSEEIGEEMADRAIEIILGQQRKGSVLDQDIMDFKKPIVTACCIPGNRYLLMVRRPGPIVPLEVLINQLDFGSILVTGSAYNPESPESDYFRIILNDQNVIIDIVCLSTTPLDEDNIVQLYGRHERMLNQLQIRYKSHLVSDLYEFFKEPWAFVYYHDRFDSLLDRVRRTFFARLPKSDKAFIDLIAEALRDAEWNELPQSSASFLESVFQCFPQLKKKIAKKVTKFLNDNKNHLPMASSEDFMRSIRHTAQESFIYTTRKARLGGKPLVNKPYSFEKHKQMQPPQTYYEKIE